MGGVIDGTYRAGTVGLVAIAQSLGFEPNFGTRSLGLGDEEAIEAPPVDDVAERRRLRQLNDHSRGDSLVSLFVDEDDATGNAIASVGVGK